MDLTQIEQKIKLSGVKYALFYQPNGGNPHFLFNQLRFSSASLIKVPILLSWLELEKEGLLDRAELCDLDSQPQVHGAGFSYKLTARKLPYADVLLMMIATSDNLCTNLVIERIGIERLQRVFTEKLGLVHTACQRKLMDYDARARGLDNWVHAEECIRMYDLIGNLDEYSRKWVDSLLHSTLDAALLLRNVPRDTIDFYHKTGSMEGVLHDWGYTGGCRIFLLTNDVADEPPMFEIFGALGEFMIHTPD